MKKRIVLIALSVLTLGSVGTVLSTFYSQDEMTNFTGWQATHKVSYGIPLGWHGYSELVGGSIGYHQIVESWYSLQALTLDAVFWFALSFCLIWGTIAIVRLASTLQKRRASRNLSVINI